MGFYHLDLDALAGYRGVTVEELKNCTYKKLEAMIRDMEEDKFIKRNRMNAQDAEYERLVLKYFSPVPLLRHWFDEKKIVLACAANGVTVRDLCQETFLPPSAEPEQRYKNANFEYLRTSMESIPQYDDRGNELVARIIKKMDVYRITNTHQGLCHGKVILHLLYERYPFLKDYGYSAYECSRGQDYTIYPKNNIYTSLAALLSGDVDAILFRNREYYKWYNNGQYTIKHLNERVATEEIRRMFDRIVQIGALERANGNSPFTILEDGTMASADGMFETGSHGKTRLLQKRNQPSGSKAPFRLCQTTSGTVAELLEDFKELMDVTHLSVHICHLTDYLGEHGVEGSFDRYGKEGVSPDLGDIASHTVQSAFGWNYRGVCDLTIRIDCPEMMDEKKGKTDAAGSEESGS